MRVIKDCIAHILPVLADVINCSLASSVYMYPDTWKYKEVIPLPKEFDHEIATNYCPFCLLPMVSKVCEKAAFAQLTDYFSQQKLLNNQQSGDRL